MVAAIKFAPTVELVFDNVFLPSTHVVGGVNSATLCMMRNLEIKRVAVAAMAVEIAQHALDEMINYPVVLPWANRTCLGLIRYRSPLSKAMQVYGQLFHKGDRTKSDLS